MSENKALVSAQKLLIDSLRRELREEPYDPVTGEGCYGARSRVATPVKNMAYAMVPDTMLNDPQYATCRTSRAWKQLRSRHDFEYWASTCVVLKDKRSERDVPFVLNAPQRRVLAVLERDRLAERPIRMILLKARQWGGSTLVQMYMAWIQLCHRRNWNSVICAHLKDTSTNILGMYSKMLAHYPERFTLRPYEKSANTRVITGRGCRITVASSESPDSVRGGDYAMAHLSETAYWRETATRSPRTVIQAVCGSIALLPYSMVVIESTARGVGDYFHTEWVRACGGQSDKRAVFVPWYEIEHYRSEEADATAVLSTLSDYEQSLWERGCDTRQIEWYRRKAREFDRESLLQAEFPSSDSEAFLDSSEVVFSVPKVEALRVGCGVDGRTGDIDASGRLFTEDASGKMKMWARPRSGRRYVVAVDVGGRSVSSDWSVIAVLDADSERPAVVAQWRGHIDHDLLARKSVAVARYYRNALLVIESNTYETSECGSSSDSNLFVLWRLADEYPNVYRREVFDTVTQKKSERIGFHTNRSTKALLISGLIEAVRDGTYVERDPEACNEMLTYRQRPNGSYAAQEGCHDDILMTRAMALHVIREGRLPPILPEVYEQWQNW